MFGRLIFCPLTEICQVASVPDSLKVLVGCAHEMVPCMNFEPAGLYEMPDDEPVPACRRLETRAGERTAKTRIEQSTVRGRDNQILA